jgi:hypothetical protein
MGRIPEIFSRLTELDSISYDAIMDKGDIAAWLDELLVAGKTVMLGRDEDGHYHGSADRKHSSATSLEGMIEGLTDHPRMKTCSQGANCCGGNPTHPLWAFRIDANAADGHAKTCRACDARKSAEQWRKRKKTSA